jgi:UDP-N-acetylmuramoyl-L-alanyl-D-glutamate--2,6-diaminopimelate ligase
LQKHTTPYHNIVDRREAIFRAVKEARSGDVVLIAGKGHEDYQIIGKDVVHFDDREVASEALKTRE